MLISFLFCTFAVDMKKITRYLVWLGRIHHSYGFGIQSPTDYAFVRFVINEHSPYYAYSQLDDLSDEWLTRKLGKLYFRLANWRQPSIIRWDEYAPYWQAGCRKVSLKKDIDRIELVRYDIQESENLTSIYNKVDDKSVVVIEKIFKDWKQWHEIEHDPRTVVTFDLYYCGIVFFDKKRQKKNYKVNF